MAVARYLDVALPADAVWWHTPNGGKRTRAEAGKFKAMGVRAGFPDIAILWNGKLLVIELKAPGRPTRISDAQHAMSDRLIAAGATWRCVTCLESVALILDMLGVPVRARPFGAGVRRIAA